MSIFSLEKEMDEIKESLGRNEILPLAGIFRWFFKKFQMGDRVRPIILFLFLISHHVELELLKQREGGAFGKTGKSKPNRTKPRPMVWFDFFWVKYRPYGLCKPNIFKRLWKSSPSHIFFAAASSPLPQQQYHRVASHCLPPFSF